MWQDSSTGYGASSSHGAPQYYQHTPAVQEPLQFYAQDNNSWYPGSRPSLDGQMRPQGPISQGGGPGFSGNIQTQGGFWSAFGTGGFEGEPPLLEGE